LSPPCQFLAEKNMTRTLPQGGQQGTKHLTEGGQAWAKTEKAGNCPQIPASLIDKI